MLNIRFHKDAVKFLRSLDTKQEKRVVDKIARLRQNPFPPESKQLKGFPFYRIAVAEFRVIYNVEEQTLFVYLVGKRNDDEIYKLLKRKNN